MENVAFDYLPIKYKEAKLSYTHVFDGIMTIREAFFRESLCTNYVNKVMPFGVGKIIIDQFNTETKLSKLVVSDIKNRIMDEFKELFSADYSTSENDWMDELSKKASLDKANILRSSISYESFLFNSSFMQNLYNVCIVFYKVYGVFSPNFYIY
jgi:hypothetical protein